jgi:hypothetical protein
MLSADEARVIDFWTHQRRHYGLLAREKHDQHYGTIQECITYLRENVQSITARIDPLLQLRFGIALRRTGLERAVKALEARLDKSQVKEFLELVDYLSSRLSHAAGTDADDLRGLADDLRVACDGVVERLYVFLSTAHTPAD